MNRCQNWSCSTTFLQTKVQHSEKSAAAAATARSAVTGAASHLEEPSGTNGQTTGGFGSFAWKERTGLHGAGKRQRITQQRLQQQRREVRNKTEASITVAGCTHPDEAAGEESEEGTGGERSAVARAARMRRPVRLGSATVAPGSSSTDGDRCSRELRRTEGLPRNSSGGGEGERARAAPAVVLQQQRDTRKHGTVGRMVTQTTRCACADTNRRPRTEGSTAAHRSAGARRKPCRRPGDGAGGLQRESR